MGEEATRPKTTPPISAQVLLYMSATADHPAAQLSLGAMVWSRRASSRSIAPTGGGRAAAGGSRLESLLDSQLGLERAGRARKGSKVNNTIRSTFGEPLLAGEVAFLPELESEPFFVKLDGRRAKDGGTFVYSTKEMGTEWFGSVFRDVGDELGFKPHSSGQNSVRRNAMVNVQKGAEHAGFDAAMHAKKVSQHRGDGQACREKVYEDSTATTDIGAFLMGAHTAAN